LPSATETLFALGLGDQLVAVTHECDYPPEAAALPVVTHSTFDLAGKSSQDLLAVTGGPYDREVIHRDELVVTVVDRWES